MQKFIKQAYAILQNSKSWKLGKNWDGYWQFYKINYISYSTFLVVFIYL